jgi:hypothetical protein
MPSIEILLNYVLGSTTLASTFIAWKSRNSEIKKAEASALENMQSVYDKFTAQTEQRFEQMQKIIDTQSEEIRALKGALLNSKSKCTECAKTEKV